MSENIDILKKALKENGFNAAILPAQNKVLFENMLIEIEIKDTLEYEKLKNIFMDFENEFIYRGQADYEWELQSNGERIFMMKSNGKRLIIDKNGSFKKSVGVQSEGKKTELIVTEEIIRNTRPESQPIVQVTPMHLKNELITETETATIGGVCKGETEKALLIEFEGARQIWIPKSTIRSGFDPRSVAVQQFKIDTQALRKNHHSENLLNNEKTIIKV